MKKLLVIVPVVAIIMVGIAYGSARSLPAPAAAGDIARSLEERMPAASQPADAAPDAGAPAADGVREFTVRASNFSFTPSALILKKGERVRLTFVNDQGMHDFKINELGVSTKTLKSGESETVEFTPAKSGTFESYCSIGAHRAMGMKGTVTVE